MPNQIYLRVAVPTPLRKTFDYLSPKSAMKSPPLPGCRVKVPFGQQKITALILEVSEKTQVPDNKLKRANEILDTQPIILPVMLEWLRWMADYYHHPIGEVIFTAIPAALRQGRTLDSAYQPSWRLTSAQEDVLANLKRAPKQLALAQLLSQHPLGLDADQLNHYFENWRTPLKGLIEKNLVEEDRLLRTKTADVEIREAKPLNDEQLKARTAVLENTNAFHGYLLDGVTGSGKTEVYLSVIDSLLTQGKQCLVLVPEIGLTPQFVRRFKQRFGEQIALLHSGMNDSERLRHWLSVKIGDAKILIGTRSALFTPFKNLGIIIVDEEHDSSFKQQDGFRYSARDMAVVRAKREGIPLLLGSATPSLETLHNAKMGRYKQLHLSKRAGAAVSPRFHVVDLKGQIMRENFSPVLINTMRDHLKHHNQVLLFLNRRGFAPSLICHECAWVAMCRRCELPMTIHVASGRLRCHHCGAEKAIPRQCPECSNIDLKPRGYGTERVEAFLHETFPNSEVIRVDRDSTRKKNSLHELLEKVREGENQILLGTQMLAKGHDFPNVTLVGILDADQGLYGTDFRALEKLAQLITQVAGRAGRGHKPGQVLIQTHYPDHPLLQILIEKGYGAFAQQALEERKAALLPPHSYAAVIRAEATQRELPMALLQENSRVLYGDSGLMLLGPTPSPIEKKAGRFRAQLLLLSNSRQVLHQALSKVIPLLEKQRKIRWSVDIDPIDLS